MEKKPKKGTQKATEAPRRAATPAADQELDEVLIDCKQGIITARDIQRSIEEFTDTLHDPEVLYINAHKSFNGLLRYIYTHNVRHIMPNTYNRDYVLLDGLFMNIYLPLCYEYNRIPTVNGFFSNLLLQDYSDIYNIKTGTYRTDDSKINPNTLKFLKKWQGFCNNELIDSVMMTGNVGGIFVAKTRGFSDQAPISIELHGVDAPRIDEKQLQTLIAEQAGPLPE